ncbi:MAG: recombination protein RecR [Acidobacteria bacterium]|nr:recombination protein RecR [Acidobacteriota bacterium]
MQEYSEPIIRLIDELRRLPGIGQKSAQRIAFHLMRRDAEETRKLVQAITDVKERIVSCSVCNNLTDVDPCRYCASPARDHSLICVVEEPANLVAIERTREYKGLYHILHGALSPIRGVGPEDLKIKSLLERLRTAEVKEIILATNPNTEGEATATYLARLLKPLGLRVSRIGMGLPVGSDLDFADEVTMHRALANRREL